MRCGAITGQNLIAIEFEDSVCQMHTRTEDEDAMADRASVSDYMPVRFEISLSKYELEITSIISCDLSTQIPVLEKGGKFYFH